MVDGELWYQGTSGRQRIHVLYRRIGKAKAKAKNELGGEVCIIDELYVAPSARSRGVAGALVTGLLRRELPWFERAVSVELEVTTGNARARALYERLGFRPYKNALIRARRAPP